MPYDRVYTLQEVARILYESELRPSPKTGEIGHALGLHGDMRQDVTDKRFRPVILLGETVEASRKMDPKLGVAPSIPPSKPEPKDGKILSRKDMIRAVAEALNSPGGQAELRKLNGAEDRVVITMKLVENAGKIKVAACQHPMINQGTGKNKVKVFAAGPSFYSEGIADTVTMVVDKLPPPNLECDVHIQTAYAKM